MTVNVRVEGLDDERGAIRAHAAARVAAALRRFGRDIGDVLVRIVDENGARGGIDTRCRVVVTGSRIGVAMVEARAGSARVAVDGAAPRLSRLVARQLDRVRRDRMG